MTIVWAIIIAAVLVAALLVPYLIQEIERGKAQKRANSPVGAGDSRTGTISNPAPGQPDGQADPYTPRARR
jgi:hypothetical protein